MGNIAVIARDLADERFATLLCESGHAIVADEPVALGGLGLGPDPYDLLLMGLGACTSMTLRLYARRKNLPLERVEVELTHGRIHADDCNSCETDDVHLERIERRLALHGPLTAEQKASLMAIADRCPVHRTLSGRIVIVSSLREPPVTPSDSTAA